MFLSNSTVSLSLRKKNTLTDGQLTCCWLDVIKIFEDVSTFLQKHKIGMTDCLALECENSVPSALILLYLLEKGHSFLLLPQTNQPTAIPSFCRYQIIPNSLGKIDYLKKFDQWLKITKNEEYQPIQGGEKKLYIRTSGSTGNPKIVVHSHEQVLKNALNCLERLTLSPNDRIAIPVPLYHLYGLGAAFLPSVAVGATIDLQKSANLLRYLEREKDFNPNVAFMTPSFCETLIKGRKSARDYKLTVIAGDRIKEDTFTKYEHNFGRLVTLYGSTEMGAIAAASPQDQKDVRCQTVGLPMSGVKIRIETQSIDSQEQGVGEIYCQHPAGFDGYVDTVGQLMEQVNQDAYVAMKDLGKLRTDGYLEVWGRCDRSVNRDGILVLFSDIEKSMKKIPGIENIVVESWGENQRGKGLVAFCILSENANLQETDIKASCFDILPKRSIPDQIIIIKALPMLPNGKIDRQKLISILPRRV